MWGLISKGRIYGNTHLGGSSSLYQAPSQAESSPQVREVRRKRRVVLQRCRGLGLYMVRGSATALFLCETHTSCQKWTWLTERDTPHLHTGVDLVCQTTSTCFSWTKEVVAEVFFVCGGGGQTACWRSNEGMWACNRRGKTKCVLLKTQPCPRFAVQNSKGKIQFSACYGNVCKSEVCSWYLVS